MSFQVIYWKMHDNDKIEYLNEKFDVIESNKTRRWRIIVCIARDVLLKAFDASDVRDEAMWYKLQNLIDQLKFTSSTRKKAMQSLPKEKTM